MLERLISLKAFQSVQILTWDMIFRALATKRFKILVKLKKIKVYDCKLRDTVHIANECKTDFILRDV